MFTNETLEQELDNLLERYHLLYWKRSGLTELIQNAKREKKHWEAIDNIRMSKDMSRIIELADSLMETEAA